MFQAAGRKVPEQFMQPPPSTCHKKKDVVTILQAHDDYVKEQEWTLHIKPARSAKCTFSGCKIDIQRGTECLFVNGALAVPYNNNNKAVEQKFYFCENKMCLSGYPSWTNIKQLDCFMIEQRRYQKIDLKVLLMFVHVCK